MAIWLMQAGSASATTLCVPNITIPGCPGSAANEPTIQDAVNNAATTGDTILIGPDSSNGGPYKESVDDRGKQLTFIGAGPTKTIIQAQGSPGMNISSGSKVSNLGIEVYPTGGNTGLQLAGTATNVAITAQAEVTYAVGVQLNGGAFRHGTVSLPINVSEPTGYGGVVGKGTVSNSAIAAGVGVADDSTNFQTPNVIRDRIRANQGVLVGPGVSPVVEDSLIRTVGGPSSELGVALEPNVIYGSFTIRHTTIVGSNSAGSTGVWAHAYGITLTVSTSVLIESVILRGYRSSIRASANADNYDGATTTVTVRHTFYNPATSHTSTSGGNSMHPAHASIHRDSHSGNFNPLFVNPAAGNFQLQAGSRAIDAGSPTLASGEPTTDLAGKPRRIVGRKGDAAISDVGAYEFRPHVPTVHATASASTVSLAQPVTFHATGADASPGDKLSFRWSFGGGSSASGATVSHAFSSSGKHTVSVTVTDLDRFTATAHITVTVRRRHH